MRKIMAIDFSGICHALMYSIGDFDLKHNGNPTGIIYGFFTQLHFLQRTIKPTVTCILCDSKHSQRLKLYPIYKEKRAKEKAKEDEKTTKKRAQTYMQMAILRRKILPRIGFNNIFMQPGYEADDIFASIQKGYPQSQIVIVSRDQDLYQLLNNSTQMFDPQTKKFTTKATFEKDYGITPKQWVMVKQTAGCTTDNVKGIDGVGEAKAIKYILGTQPKGKILDKIESDEGQEIIKRNKILVELPFPGTKSFKIVENDFNREKFKEVCEALDFQSILQTINEWNFV